MKLQKEQCLLVFRVDRPDCRACSGYSRSCPDYIPARGTEEASALTGKEENTNPPG